MGRLMRCAMVLAAGLGLRMRPLTENTAKPLLPLGGRTLLDHALDRLEAAGVERVVINTHWQGNRVEQHLASRKSGMEIILRPEFALLDTGGAVRSALVDGVLRDDPFFIVNGDSFWLDGPSPALGRVAEAFGPDVDSVLLLHRTFQVHSEVGFGDFALDPWGKIRRRKEREIAPYLFAGVQLASPALFADAPAGSFSLNALWDTAIESGRLRALVHDGLWFHLSRPSDLSEAETALHARETGETR
jgi:MurNAc alpha-1-phosphate uridylyltransferase